MTTSRSERLGSSTLLLLTSASLSLVWACRERPTLEGPNRDIAVGGAAAGSPSTVEGTLPNEPDSGCVPGAVRCAGAALQTCAEDGSGFVTSEVCDSAALCQLTPAGCGVASCVADEMSCDGAELMICSPELTGFEAFATCDSAAHCSSADRRCLTEPCASGDLRCNRQADGVPALESCDDSQEGWESVGPCETRQLCDATLAGLGLGSLATNGDGVIGEGAEPAGQVVQCLAAACQPGDVQCDGAALVACNAGQTAMDEVDICASVEVCALSLEALPEGGTPSCLPAACDAGTFRCTQAGALEACEDDRSGFRLVQQCIGAPFCDAANGTCNEAPCEAGAESCNDSQPQRCRDDQSGFDAIGDSCLNAALCNDEGDTAFCEEPNCLRGASSTNEYQCEGAELSRCNESLTDYELQETCETAALCNAESGACQSAFCQPEERNCEGGTLQGCNEDQTGFGDLENCGDASQCDATTGECTDPCEPGSVRCTPQGEVEVCEDRLTGWQVIADCLTPQLCNADGTCTSALCSEGETRCTEEGDGTALQECGPGRDVFVTTEICSGDQLCDASSNQCDDCEAGSVRCDGDSLVTCSADGQTENRTQCAEGLCDAEVGRCLACGPIGNSRCQGSQLFVCRQGAQGEFDAAEFCETSELCEQTLQGCGPNGEDCQCNEGACGPGEVRCSGDTLQQCNPGRTDFNFLENCESGLCNATQRRCDECEGNDSFCVDGNTRQSCNGGFIQTQNCAGNGQICDGGQCVVPACDFGEFSCNGNALQRCNNSRTGFDFVDNCGNGLCNAGAGRCNECSGNASTCVNDGTRQFCNNGLFQTQNCGAGNICENNQCRPAACRVGQRQCADSVQLQECNDSRTAFETVSFCVATGCNPQRNECNECANGQRVSCRDNNTRRTCSDGRIQDIRCPNGQFCSDSECVACDVGQRRCLNNIELQQCNANQSAFERITLCTGGGCNTQRNECNECAPGNQPPRCDANTRVVCQNDGTFSRQPCGNGLQCELGQCIVPRICIPGQIRCNGQRQQQCNDQGTAFNNLAFCTGTLGRRCASAQVVNVLCGGGTECNPANGRCRTVQVCQPGSQQCLNAIELQRCESDGSGFETITLCTSTGCNAQTARCNPFIVQ